MLRCLSHRSTRQTLTPGILLGISQFSPRQYDKVNIIISSNEVGVFALEMNVATSSATGSTIGSPGGGGGSQLGGHGGTIVGREEVRMEDLLQAQFDNEQNLLLFEGMATFSINMLVHQINKSELARLCSVGCWADGQSSMPRWIRVFRCFGGPGCSFWLSIFRVKGNLKRRHPPSLCVCVCANDDVLPLPG